MSGSLAPEPALADDLIQPFHVPALDLHGRLVRLGPAVDAILTAHDYPRPVSVLLGEALALTAALAGALKFEGTFTIHVLCSAQCLKPSIFFFDKRIPGA